MTTLPKIGFGPATPRAGLLTRLATWGAVARQRRALRQMDDHQLRDIGISRVEALSEAARPVWDAPSNWR